ncbi:hypothetical protein CR513_54366, partial [Mucuna pruriens]
MYRQVVSRGTRPSLFLGKAYHAGCPPNPGAGSLELIPHNTVHTWTDSLDSKKLGYDYQQVDIPWLKVNHRRKYPRSAAKQAHDQKYLSFPLTLSSIARTTVNRPKQESRSDQEKEEVLVIDIDYDKTKGIRFDVLINDQGDDQIRPVHSEFAGSFVSLAHSHLHGDGSTRTSTSFSLGITNLLEDIEVKDDDSIVVTLVPRYGEKYVTIKGIKIKHAALEDENI